MMLRPLADAAAIIVIIEVLIVGLIPLALLAGMTYGMIRLIAILRPFLKQVQRVSKNIAARSEQVSQALAEPIIETSSREAAAEAFVDRLRTSTNGR